VIFYSGWQWLLIDAATHFGLDKLTFEERIQWTLDHLHELENLASEADTKPLYVKAVMAIRKAQKGLPTGHLVGVDGCCSGIQMMSVLTGCIAGATATGLVDPNKRADAYTDCTAAMNALLAKNNTVVNVARKQAKEALMTVMYGSKAKPKEIFGEDTPELHAFYQAAQEIAPGAWQLLQELLSSWRPWALMHRWVMPDGFDARIKVMEKVTTRIEVDELDHASFTYEYYENIGSKSGLSNAANVVHSVDSYVLRTMHRRCNYNREIAEYAQQLIEIEMIRRHLDGQPNVVVPQGKAGYYVEHYNRSGIADVVILPYLDATNIEQLSQAHLEKLAEIVNGMLQYKPFELVTIHDDFKAHPNNVNWVRWQYKEILADISESKLIDDLLSQIYGIPGTFQRLSNNLGSLIRQSNYALT
jgi:DNA-dependent RNA polymerase